MTSSRPYQTILAATNALKGAPYTVNWANFIGGPPVIAAETSGSVDLGFMAETPTIFAQAAGDPVKVVAATIGVNPKVSPYAIVVPANSPIKSISQLKGQRWPCRRAPSSSTSWSRSSQKAHIPYSAVHHREPDRDERRDRGDQRAGRRRRDPQPLTGIDLTTGKIRVLAQRGRPTSQTLGYLTASNRALANPQKAAAIADFIVRFDKAQALLRKKPDAGRPDLRQDLRRAPGRGQAGRRLGPDRRARRSHRPS